jgi:hypothetical protein
MSRFRVFLFKAGALGVAICSVLLLIAVLASAFVQRELSAGEKLVAFAVAVILGTVWWLLMLRRLRASGKNV